MIPRLTPYAGPFCLAALGLYAAWLACRRQSSGPHPDGCPCGPCADFENAVRDALALVAETVPALRRDGKPLTGREHRALRGIETAIRNEQEGAGL